MRSGRVKSIRILRNLQAHSGRFPPSYVRVPNVAIFCKESRGLEYKVSTRAGVSTGKGRNMNDDVTPSGLLGEILNLTLLLRASQARFDPDAPDHGRAGVKNALIAFQWFVARVCPNGTELVLPINELLYALEDLDRGRLAPLFHHVVTGGRHPTGLSAKLFRSIAAVLMTLYQDEKMGVDDPASAVARKLNRLGYRDDGNQRITGDQVNAWRNEVRATKGKNTPGGKQYRTTLSMLSKQFPSDPKGAVRLVLSSLPEMHRLPITKKVRTSL